MRIYPSQLLSSLILLSTAISQVHTSTTLFGALAAGSAEVSIVGSLTGRKDRGINIWRQMETSCRRIAV